ncbi:MAG: right-handed parallel beta-helix repeat-containing protein [Phycisphaerales bacterium]|nr:right-handed parallel beta-helix repeat-containing protein [Phycisphaerales bacterium]
MHAAALDSAQAMRASTESRLKRGVLALTCHAAAGVRTMNAKTLIRNASLAMAIVGAITLVVVAGPLDPPSGPVQPTGRTQINQQYFITSLPYTISTQGSYVLTGDLIGVAGQHGIVVNADNVTIDLNGFSIAGVPSSLDGINAVGFRENLTVRNGLIRDWGGNGMQSNTAQCRVENVIAIGNGAQGIDVGGSSVITGCVAQGNGFDGINSGGGAIIGCVSDSNGGTGIDSAGLVADCVSEGNSGDGINVAGDSLVRGCRVVRNGRGVTTGIGVCVVGCVVSDNDAEGIVAGTGSTVSGCNVRVNGADGILVDSGCLVVGNNCERNGLSASGAGVHVTGSDNRIEGNELTNADFGVRIEAAGSLVIKNSASGNTINYSILAGNDVGPIGTAAASASPWANIAY